LLEAPLELPDDGVVTGGELGTVVATVGGDELTGATVGVDVVTVCAVTARRTIFSTWRRLCGVRRHKPLTFVQI
jgi:hypothetical protein